MPKENVTSYSRKGANGKTVQVGQYSKTTTSSNQQEPLSTDQYGKPPHIAINKKQRQIPQMSLEGAQTFKKNNPKLMKAVTKEKTKAEALVAKVKAGVDKIMHKNSKHTPHNNRGKL